MRGRIENSREVDVSQSASLREIAVRIWKAGVDAVDSGRLVRNVVRQTGGALSICGQEIALADLGRLVVVGAGKAGAGMAAAFEEAAGDAFLDEKVSGWVNVPADCVRSLRRIHLHAARPAGVNEPTREGVAGTQRIRQMMAGLGPNDVCVILLSGGGSALLPAPVDGLGLEDKQAVTRLLMHAGATIQELNTVRKQLSQVKGGRLVRNCRAGLILTLIISDVIGDPLDVIASGPTVADESTPEQALEILRRYFPDFDRVPAAVVDLLSHAVQRPESPVSLPDTAHNYVIGNNAFALGAAAETARQLGFTVHSLGADNQGEAKALGRELAELCLAVRDHANPIAPPACLLSGGEPVVHLAPTDQPRKGGRNQELVLAGVERLWNESWADIVLLSGGTDGEDGPTDAAGALADRALVDAARSLGLRPNDFLAINNSYLFFEQTGGLLKTGPTHTNVMDLRVALVGRSARRQ